MPVLNKSTGVILTRVESIDRSVDMADLPNPFDDTLLHEHRCANCNIRFTCTLPDCTGSWLDPQLCQGCDEAIGSIWSR